MLLSPHCCPHCTLLPVVPIPDDLMHCVDRRACLLMSCPLCVRIPLLIYLITLTLPSPTSLQFALYTFILFHLFPSFFSLYSFSFPHALSSLNNAQCTPLRDFPTFSLAAFSAVALICKVRKIFRSLISFHFIFSFSTLIGSDVQ